MCVFLLSAKEGRLKVRFNNSKSMSHTNDVTYLYINEAIQKMQNQHQKGGTKGGPPQTKMAPHPINGHMKS